MSDKNETQKDENMPQTMATKEYGIFQKMDGNREIDRYHLRKLMESISNDNQLRVHPIVVDKDFRIIDGQHRLEVARQLGVEVYFVQSESISEDHLIHCNVNQKSWEIEDYINYFAAKKVPEYIEIKNMLEATSLKPKALITLLVGNVNVPILNKLKVGKFEMAKDASSSLLLNFFLEFMTYVKDKRIKPYSMFTNFNFTKALRWLYKTNGFDKEILFKKLDQKWFDLRPQSSSEEWYRLLIGIYNFKNQNKLSEEFLTEK